MDKTPFFECSNYILIPTLNEDCSVTKSDSTVVVLLLVKLYNCDACTVLKETNNIAAYNNKRVLKACVSERRGFFFQCAHFLDQWPRSLLLQPPFGALKNHAWKYRRSHTCFAGKIKPKFAHYYSTFIKHFFFADGVRFFFSHSLKRYVFFWETAAMYSITFI